MDRLEAEQSLRNAKSRDRWELFTSHRQEVTSQLTRGFPLETGRLCVLGAGNSNDLDLAALCRTFREVHLVDLDAEALASGVARQRPDRVDRIHLHGAIDVTGVYDELSHWVAGSEPSDVQVDACIQQVVSFGGPNLPAPFDVVASVCLLSQLVESAVLALSQDHPRFADLVLALRTRHVRLLWELLSPGGWGVLISDFVSSDTCADMAEIPAHEFAPRMRQLVGERNFFHGVNPFALEKLLRDDPLLSAGVARRQLVRPWRWDFGPRMYAVCALKFQRAGERGSLEPSH